MTISVYASCQSKKLLRVEQNKEKKCITHRCKTNASTKQFFADDKGLALEVGKDLLRVSK